MAPQTPFLLEDKQVEDKHYILVHGNTMQCLIFLIVLCSIGILDATDAPYLQDASFRSVFPPEADSTAFISKSWPLLPFTLRKDMPKKGGIISAGPCMVTLSNGLFYGSAEISPSVPIGIENPYTAWEVIGDSGYTDMRVMSESTAGKNGTSFYALTKDNIAQVTFSSPDADNKCGKLSNIKLLLSSEKAQDWGRVSGVQYSPSMHTLFIGSFDKGVAVATLDATATVTELSRIAAAGDASSAMLWVEKWNTLYTANDLAFYTIRYNVEKKNIVEEQHEWIGGILGTTPTDMTYDCTNDVVWIAESECIHRLTKEYAFWRFGYQQGAPMLNITSVAAHNGIVYSGSPGLGVARLSGAQSAAQLDISPDSSNSFVVGGPDATGKDGDPWSWSYYYGPRWLPSNHILALTSSSQANRNSVFVVTDIGMALLNVGQMTLAEKAVIQESFQYPRHDRHGLSTSVHLPNAGDLTEYYKEVGDNDGLWTSMAAMAEVYRYQVTKSPEARATAWRMFEGLELLGQVTGAYPSFVARTFTKLSDNDYGIPTALDPDCTDDCWYASPNDAGWWYKGDTSSDELCGHMAIYPMLYDSVASTEEEKARVLKLYDGLIGGIVDNDLYLIQPATGKRTLWGFWNPKELNHEPEHYSERGLNSLQILGWLSGAYSITGNQKYHAKFWELVNEHKYVQNTVNVKIDSALDENHSDTELIMLAYQALFYAYERLPAHHERKSQVWDMVSLMVPSLQKTFLLLKGELNPLWLGIYAGTAAQTAHVTEKDISDVVWSLRHWAIDNINWNIMGSQRIDLDISHVFLVRPFTDPTKTIMRHIRPASERASAEENRDPFEVNPGGASDCEYEPGVYLLPYYIMAYHKLL